MPFALDIPDLSFLEQLSKQPYPPVPTRFPFSESVYEATLHPLTPILISLSYILLAKLANRSLARSAAPVDHVKGSPLAFRAVLLHNVALALYSGWTCFNVVRIIAPYFWGGISQGGAQGLAHAFCSVPTHDPLNQLSGYTVLFYYSKVYELVDSLILWAKGKKISSLQSYHHSGAILTMYAGVRWSGNPIWLFLSFNGFVHTLMYSYYSCSLLRIPLPRAFKKALTQIQITQLITGGAIAASYFFVRYSPVAFPAAVVPFPSAVVWEKGYAFFQSALSASAGSGARASPPSFYAAAQDNVTRTLLRSVNRGTTPCLSTSGAVFATGANVGYLIPLILLFFRFFIASYIQQGKKKLT